MGAWGRKGGAEGQTSILRSFSSRMLIFGVIFTSFTDTLSTEQEKNEAWNQEEGGGLWDNSLSSTTVAKSVVREAETECHNSKALHSHLQHCACRNLSTPRGKAYSLMWINVDHGPFYGRRNSFCEIFRHSLSACRKHIRKKKTFKRFYWVFFLFYNILFYSWI